MAKAKTTEKAPAGDLAKTLADKRRELQALGFKAAGAKVPNVRQARALRRDIARALTAANLSGKQPK